MSATTALDMEAGDKLRTTVTTYRPSKLRWVGQPLVCLIAVVGSLTYVRLANVSESEPRSLGASSLRALLRQVMTISLIETVLVSAFATPLGILLPRGSMRRL